MKSIIRFALVTLALGLAASHLAAAEEAARPVPAEALQRLQEIAQKLALTDEQKAQIQPILEKEIADLKALQENTALRRAQKARKAREILQSSSTQIRARLTPDQQKQYDAMRAEAQEHMRDRLRDRANQRSSPPPTAP